MEILLWEAYIYIYIIGFLPLPMWKESNRVQFVNIVLAIITVFFNFKRFGDLVAQLCRPVLFVVRKRFSS